jgi:uncharacterized protein (UPF0335 family)
MTTITDPNLLARIDSVISNGVAHKLKTKESLSTLNEDIKAVAKDSGVSAKALRRMIRIAASENPQEEGDDTDTAYEILRQLKRVS